MDFYGLILASLIFFNIALAYHRRHLDKREKSEDSLALPSNDGRSAATQFERQYFSLYGLVMAADWLQGPYMYTLYKDEKEIAEATVALLFTTGFVTGGISASFVGALADRYGRKAACMSFCVAYSLSCLSVLSDDIFVLFIGRALGGLSTTLLYSVFETWMIAEYHRRELKDSLNLGSMFSFSVTLSGIVAIGAGVAGEALVEYSGTKKSPFIAAFFCLVVAFVGIQRQWNENYGEVAAEKDQGKDEILSILRNRSILTLGTTTTLFEGCMYLFVFFWAPALVSSRSVGGKDSGPPFGIIFSCFMCAMMLGSQVFSLVKPGNARDAATLMLSILALGSWAFLAPVLLRSENMTFWSFALFEGCVGMYFPTMSRLKSDIVPEAVRAKVYGWMRLPLNIFVVVALAVTRDGDEHRAKVFTAAGSLLLVASWIVQRELV